MEFRVPIMLRASTTPLYLKIVLLTNFPVKEPKVLILTRVVHKDIDPSDYSYKGPGIK
jgi:hypothetical protein